MTQDRAEVNYQVIRTLKHKNITDGFHRLEDALAEVELAKDAVSEVELLDDNTGEVLVHIKNGQTLHRLEWLNDVKTNKAGVFGIGQGDYEIFVAGQKVDVSQGTDYWSAWALYEECLEYSRNEEDTLIPFMGEPVAIDEWADDYGLEAIA